MGFGTGRSTPWCKNCGRRYFGHSCHRIRISENERTGPDDWSRQYQYRTHPALCGRHIQRFNRTCQRSYQTLWRLQAPGFGRRGTCQYRYQDWCTEHLFPNTRWFGTYFLRTITVYRCTRVRPRRKQWSSQWLSASYQTKKPDVSF